MKRPPSTAQYRPCPPLIRADYRINLQGYFSMTALEVIAVHGHGHQGCKLYRPKEGSEVLYDRVRH